MNVKAWLVAIMFPLSVAACGARAAPAEVYPKAAADIDATVTEWLAQTNVPSASIAIVLDGKIAYAQAYGAARLSPNMRATTETRYAIDSISKEFTAAAILILAQQNKLSLDDPAGKYLTNLGPAAGVTIRQLLTHTAGLRDFWPQDFDPPEMTRPTTTAAIIAEWAKRPLDFPPGTAWQYSNTGFVVAAAIVEKVGGQPLMPFLQQNIFTPLGMAHVTEDDTGPLSPPDAAAYTRHGLGPTVPAPKEGPGWLFGAAELAMRPSDLALWDISLIGKTLLTAASYEAAFKSVILQDGTDTHYGLGLDIEDIHGRRRIGHEGAGSGFLSANRIWPDDKIAIVVFTNDDWAGPSALVDRIAFVILPPKPEEARARAVFAGFQRGEVDRTLFTDNGNFYLTGEVLADLKTSLGTLGPARLIELERETKRGGMVKRVWKIICGTHRLEAVERGYLNGKLEQFMVNAAGD